MGSFRVDLLVLSSLQLTRSTSKYGRLRCRMCRCRPSCVAHVTGRSVQGVKEWDDYSHNLSPRPQRPVHDAEAEEGRTDVSSLDSSFKANLLFTNGESIQQRMLPDWTEKLEKEKGDMASEVALLLQKLEHIVEESGREREFHENEISSLKTQVREKDEAVFTRDAQLEELEAANMLSEQKLRTALDATEKEKEQLLLECMDFKSQVGRLAEERDMFLKELEEERDSGRTRLQKLQVQLEDIVSEKLRLEDRLGESTNDLEELRVVNKQLSDELAVSEQERRMVVMNVAEERNMLTDRIKTMEDEQLKFHALVEHLTHRLSMYQENDKASEALNVQVKNFEDECKRLELVVENLGISLQSLEHEKAELGSQFGDLQVEKEELITEVEIAKNELKVAQSQLEFLRVQQSEIVEELTSVKLELSKALADKTKMELNEEESRQKLEHLTHQFGKFEIERSEIVESSGQKLQVAEEDIRILEEHKVSLEEQLARAKHELNQLNERLKMVDIEKAELDKTSAITIEALERQIRILGGEHSSLEEQCQTLRVELQLSNEKVNALAVEKVELEATAGMLHQKAMVLEDRNSDLDQRLNVLIEEKDRLTSELRSSQRTSETVLEETVQLKSELRLLQEELLRIKEEKIHIQSDWEALQEKLNVITAEKESVVNQLKESQDALQKMSEKSGSVISELSVVMKKLDESTVLKNKLIGDLQSLQETLQGAKEAKARVEIELEESLSKLNDSIQEKILLSNRLDTLLQSVQVLEIEKLEFVSQVQQLQEAVNQKDEEITMCKEERKPCEVDHSAKVETEVGKSHELAIQICNLKAELKTLEHQLEEMRGQKNKASDEPYSPTLDKKSKEMTLVDFENASPRSHAANVKLVKKLVEVFEGKVTDVVPVQSQRGLMSPVTEFFIQVILPLMCYFGIHAICTSCPLHEACRCNCHCFVMLNCI